ncbi:MAG: HAD-IIIA family hydrolase [Pirellulaceae bacterium]
MKLDQRMQAIRMILSDVDGVLTDGGIYYDNQGVETKRFHVRDGLGIKLWQKAGHQFGILTARNSHIVKVRATELNIAIVRQGFSEKLPAAQQIIAENNLKPENVCYIGDDLPDLAVMQNVGMAIAVADAAPEVRAIAHMTTKTSGGQGAVRELIESILTSQKRWSELMNQYGNNTIAS